MIYLKSLIKRNETDAEILGYIENIKNDKEGIEYLLTKGYTFDGIISQMESHYGFKYVNLDDYNIGDELIADFDGKFLRSQKMIPYKLDEEERTYYFAMNDVINSRLRESVRKACVEKGYNKVSFHFAFEHEIIRAYKRIEERKRLTSGDTQTQTEDDTFNAQGFVTKVINKAIAEKASDIHIENLETSLQIRYRIDGMLTEKKIYPYDKSIVSNIVVRTKIISGLDISEKRKPQDGRIENYEYRGSLYDLRVSTVNTVFGEKIVMRLFDKSSGVLSFEQLGLHVDDVEKIKRMLSHSNGIIYLAGATGSGKTTTLYTMIDHINDDAINIYTIEDPVEKSVYNVNQIQIEPAAGVDYANTLKALMRQDPDVIIVGEIRDGETAELALRASLTGHLVISTIHANNALDSISRLLNMDIDPYIMGISSLGFISQRLVRVLCPHCKAKTDKITPSQKLWLEYQGKEHDLSAIHIDEFYGPVGCDKCNGGYKGRIAVAEIVEVGEDMKELISKKANISDVMDVALSDGFKPFVVRGLEKVQEGVTSLTEIMRQIQ